MKFYCLLFVLFLTGCSREPGPPLDITRTLPFDSLNDLLMENLRTKRIVMIGDGNHGHGYYMKMVTGALERWLDELERGETPDSAAGSGLPGVAPRPPLPRQLFLFIEYDSVRTATLLRCMDTGELPGLLEDLLRNEAVWGRQEGGLSIDAIEYLHDLRLIRDRVSALNARTPLRPCDLRIVGPESPPPFERPWTTDTARFREINREYQRTKFEFFARQRDEQSSARIAKLLSENPGYRALVFYGGGHLMRGLQNKAAVGGAPPGVDTAFGYFLVTYLDRRFTRDSVSTFITINRPGSLHVSQIQELDRTALWDYRIPCSPVPQWPFPLEIINCRTTLGALFRLMNNSGVGSGGQEKAYSRGFASRLSLQLKRSYLNSLPEARPSIDSLRKWSFDTSRAAARKRIAVAGELIRGFDAVENINRLDEWVALPLRDSGLYTPMLRMVLRNLPSQGVPFENEAYSRLPMDEETRSLILARKEEVIRSLLVGLLWVGTEEEQRAAMNQLGDQTGRSFKSAGEWTDWWRKTLDERRVVSQ